MAKLVLVVTVPGAEKVVIEVNLLVSFAAYDIVVSYCKVICARRKVDLGCCSPCSGV